MTRMPTYKELEQRIEFLESELYKRKRSEEFNSTLLKISNAVNISKSLDEFFKTIHLALSSVIDMTNFFIALYNQTNDSISFPYIVDSVDEAYPPVLEISATASLTAEVIRTKSPLLITKAETLKRQSKSNLTIPTCTPAEIWLGVPLKIKGKILGVMSVQSYSDAKCYNRTDLNLMVSVAELVAIVIENMAAEESLEASENRFLWMVDLVVGGVLLGSPEGHITVANDFMCNLLGLTQKDIIGKHISELVFSQREYGKNTFSL